jgi:hypothetical protein
LRRRVADPFRSGAASLRNRRRRGPLDVDPEAAPHTRGAQPPSPVVGNRPGPPPAKPTRNGDLPRRPRRLGLRAVRRRPGPRRT